MKNLNLLTAAYTPRLLSPISSGTKNCLQNGIGNGTKLEIQALQANKARLFKLKIKLVKLKFKLFGLEKRSLGTLKKLDFEL